MNGFFASVELLDHPEYKNVPMAVCGDPESRHGIILAKNEHAKKYGIVTAETLWQARKKCPGLVTVPPHHAKYKEYSIKINEIYQQYTDLVEPFSIDESWLDVTGSLGLFESGRKIADEIRERVKSELGLTLSAGVSFNKIFAKMGSEYKKPDATTVISRDNYKELLWPMPVSEMFFCGKKTSAKLMKSGIKTIGDLANADRVFLNALLGKQGDTLYIYANGLDESPVAHYTDIRREKSVGHGTTFSRNLTTLQEIEAECISLSDGVATRLRKHSMKASGVKVDIKDDKLHVISRQQQLNSPTNLASDIYHCAVDIIRKNWKIGDPIRLITITAINLTDENEASQISLFDLTDDSKKKNEDLERAMDEIRQKFGKSSIQFGKK